MTRVDGLRRQLDVRGNQADPSRSRRQVDRLAPGQRLGRAGRRRAPVVDQNLRAVNRQIFVFIFDVLVGVAAIRLQLVRVVVVALHGRVVLLVLLVRELALVVRHGHVQRRSEHTAVGGVFVLHSEVVPCRPPNNFRGGPEREPNLVADGLDAFNRTSHGRYDPHVPQQRVSRDRDVVYPLALDHQSAFKEADGESAAG